MESIVWYVSRSASETKFTPCDHGQTIFGLLSEWTEEDSEHPNKIVHTVYCLMAEGIPSLNKTE